MIRIIEKIAVVGRYYFITMMVWMLCFVPVVLAGEGSGFTRKTWDEIMLWVNFGILAFVIVKFGRTPLMNFLRGRKESLGREIEQLEEEKKKVLKKVKETYKELEDSESRFEELKARIVEQGEKRKTEIIEDAHKQSIIIVEMSKQKAEGQIIRAKESFKAELIDAAIALATEKLPTQITDEDNQKLFEGYVATIE